MTIPAGRRATGVVLMSSFFSVFVIAGTIISLVGFFLLLHLNKTIEKPGQTTGHNFDGIEEYDNPLPAWWYWWFVLTILYGVGYLIYYPGLGNFEGIGGWSQVGQLEEDQRVADEKFGPIYAQYRGMSLGEVASHPEAVRMGRRMYASNCSVCHGAQGEGSFGFPNLTDEEWMWGNTDDDIITTIRHGRIAAMMPWEDVLGDDGVAEVTEYVLALAGRDDVDQALADKGQVHYGMFCATCHGPQGKGMKVFGAPDLTNEIWLYGNSRLRIAHVVRRGRNGVMPAFEDRLSDDKIRLLAAYVKSLGD